MKEESKHAKYRRSDLIVKGAAALPDRHDSHFRIATTNRGQPNIGFGKPSGWKGDREASF